MAEGTKLFRKKAIDILSSPEQLDRTMRFVGPKAWILLLACLASLGGLLFWGFFGSVATKVTGSGILLGMGNVVEVSSREGGRILSLSGSLNGYVEKGDVLGQIDQIDTEQKLEEAERELEDLRGQLIQAESSETSRRGYETDYTEKQRRTLEASIVSAGERARRLKEMEAKYRNLFDRQLVTEGEYNDVRDKYDKTLQDILTYRENLAKLPVSTVQSRTQWEKERRDLAYQIVQMEERVRQLRTTLEENRILTSPVSGYIVGLYRNAGEMVVGGEAVFVIEEARRALSGKEAELFAQIYVPAAQGKKVLKGMEALVTPTMIKREEYGSIRGVVLSVSDAPVSKKTMLRFLGNEDLVEQLSREGAPMGVFIDLIDSDETASGYVWTSGKGPAVTIDRNSVCSVEIVTRRQRPLSLVLPFLKKYLLGVGEGQ